MGTTMGRTQTIRRGKVKPKKRNDIVPSNSDHSDIDVIMIDDDETETFTNVIKSPSTFDILNDKNEVTTEEKSTSSEIHNESDTKMYLGQPADTSEETIYTSPIVAEEDDEIEVVKANIYKFQGKLSYDEEVDMGILNFQSYDNLCDDDEVIIEDDLEENEDFHEDQEPIIEEEELLVACDECHKLFEFDTLENHRFVKHPPKKKNVLQFEGGNFFMIAA